MASLTDDFKKVVSTLTQLYQIEGQSLEASLLSQCASRLEQTTYDNWNGGTYGYTLTLEVAPELYAKLRGIVGDKEKSIKGRLDELVRPYSNEYIEKVILTPSLTEKKISLSGPDPLLGKPDFWVKHFFRLFISHVSSIKTQASEIQKELWRFGISGFVAHEDIEPTKEWLDEIKLALGTMDALVALLTPDFKDSNWTSQEVGIGIARGALVLSVRLGLDPFGFLGKDQGYQGLNKTPAQIAAAIFDILIKNPTTSDHMARCLVDCFETVDTWEDARHYMGLIEKISVLNSSLLERLEGSIQKNVKIAESWGVPDRIKRLSRRLKAVRS